MHATTFITEQHTLEKVVQAENGAIVRLNIHIPRLESDSADAACERGLLPPGEVKAGNTAWWATLDELPFSLDDKGNISFVVRRFSAAREQYVDDRPTIPLDAQPLPQDWEQQVLTEWMAVTVVSEGQTYAPADRNESYTLRLEKAEITGTATAAFTQEKYLSPQIQSAAETRTGELNAGALTRWDGEKNARLEPDLPKRGRTRVLEHLHAGRRLFADAVYRQEKGQRGLVRFSAYRDVGRYRLHRHPPQAVGHLWHRERAFDRHLLDDLFAGRQLLHECGMGRVERDGWNGFLTGTATGTQGRTEDGTELHFILTDKNGKPCEFWAILLNDDGSPGGYSLKYRAGEQLFDRTQRQNFWKQSNPYITIVS